MNQKIEVSPAHIPTIKLNKKVRNKEDKTSKGCIS